MAKGKGWKERSLIDQLADSGKKEPAKKPTDQAEDKEQSFSAADATRKSTPRQAGVTAQGRVKFTTMIKPELKEFLGRIAKNNGLSIADVLETVVYEYFDLPKDK